MKISRLVLAACGAMLAVWACSPSYDGGEPTNGGSRLQVDLVDAPNTAVKEIWVTISKVTAHSAQAGWVTLFTGPSVKVDLLKLQSSVMQLGWANMPAGKVTQVRLYVEAGSTNEVVLPDGSHVPLKVPSGVQSGIKIKGPFDLSGCQTTHLTLDFDGKKSIWVHPTGHADEWILRPVIHAKKISKTGTECAPADGGILEGNPGGTGGGSGNAGGAGGGTGGSGGAGGGDATTPFLEGAGEPCTGSVACLSGVCTNGLCQPGAAGAPCRIGVDCASGQCQEAACLAGPAGGPGATCVQNTDCLSGTCLNGVCDTGTQGTPCATSADCSTGFTCDTGYCAPIIN